MADPLRGIEGFEDGKQVAERAFRKYASAALKKGPGEESHRREGDMWTAPCVNQCK